MVHVFVLTVFKKVHRRQTHLEFCADLFSLVVLHCLEVTELLRFERLGFSLADFGSTWFRDSAALAASVRRLTTPTPPTFLRLAVPSFRPRPAAFFRFFNNLAFSCSLESISCAYSEQC